ncbi:hypothetical protein ACIP23_36750, partial [Streptomyces sp. NPDC089733]
MERQTAAMRELSRRTLPEPPATPADAPAPIEQARTQRRRQGAATEAAALRRLVPVCPAAAPLHPRRVIQQLLRIGQAGPAQELHDIG